MLLAAIILLPFLAALPAAAVHSDRLRPWIVFAASATHLFLTAAILIDPPPAICGGWIGLDPPGELVLLLTSILFFICTLYGTGYLRQWPGRFNRVLAPCLLGFLGGATLMTCSQQLGLIWIAMETTALCTAPMIYFRRTPESIEATWKYLLICSVGIAIALLGSFFLVYAFLVHHHTPGLLFSQLVAHARDADPVWLKMAFVLLLIGYGTKMGLAPMHTWKPDAYGEVPGIVGALLAGVLTSCAFLAILRIMRVCVAAGMRAYTGHLLIAIGIFSMAVAAVFLMGQKDFKRMLAYSSVEQMGILALGAGIGGPALYGALLQMINNGLTKGMLFLSAGNIHRAYGSKSSDDVHGAVRREPVSGTLFMIGFLAITGSPPFGPFVGIFTILKAAFVDHLFLLGAAFVGLLLLVFLGMGRTVLAVTMGRPLPGRLYHTQFRDSFLSVAPPLMLLALILLLGLHVPAPLVKLLHQAQRYIEVSP